MDLLLAVVTTLPGWTAGVLDVLVEVGAALTTASGFDRVSSVDVPASVVVVLSLGALMFSEVGLGGVLSVVVGVSITSKAFGSWDGVAGVAVLSVSSMGEGGSGVGSGETVLSWSDVSTGASTGMSVHSCVSVGITVLEGETVVESGAVSEIVATVGVELVLTTGAGSVFGCPSVWPSSSSGVLRPDIVAGGAGLITGFGRRGGFPADSCADTLDRSGCRVSDDADIVRGFEDDESCLLSMIVPSDSAFFISPSGFCVSPVWGLETPIRWSMR